MAEGNTIAKAAQELKLSDRTVQKYLSVIHQKMDAKNTVHAVFKGAKAGII